ncbi:MAG: hypothetical protein OXN84_13295, partial [Albidovulum sp.]|nr:hypothetical protein [Albidovulum sp.]
MVGNDLSAHFRSTGFLVNDAALGYMRRMNLPARTVSLPAGHPRKRFSDAEARGAHPAAHGIAGIASEGERVAGTVVPGDDAGQFNVGDHHALCR